MTIIDALDRLGGLAGIAAIITALVQLRKVKQVSKDTLDLAQLTAAQFQPNHGSSMSDALSRIEKDTLTQREELIEIRKYMRSMWGSLGHQIGEVNSDLDQERKERMSAINRIELDLRKNR